MSGDLSYPAEAMQAANAEIARLRSVVGGLQAVLEAGGRPETDLEKIVLSIIDERNELQSAGNGLAEVAESVAQDDRLPYYAQSRLSDKAYYWRIASGSIG